MASGGRSAILLGLVAVVFWSASAPFSNLLRDHASFPVIVLFMQIGAVFALLLHATIKDKGLGELVSDVNRLTFRSDPDKNSVSSAIWKSWAYLIVFGLCITAYHSLFFYSLQNGPSLQLNMINYLWPVNLVIISSLFFRRNVQNASTILEFLLVPLAFLGAIIIGFDGRDILRLDFNWPMIAAFFASIFAPLYMAMGPKIVGEGHVANSRHLYIISLSITSVLQIGIYFPTGVLSASMSSISAIPISVALGIMSIAVAHVCWNDALESSRRATISTLIYLTPILSSVWLVSFFDEVVTGQFLLGASIILLANSLMSRALDEFLPAVFSLVVCGYATIAWFARSLLGDPHLVPEAYQIVPGIFAILAGFMLSRMWSRNAELERLYIDWLFQVRAIRDEARAALHRNGAKIDNLDDRVDRLMRLSLDIKVRSHRDPTASGSLLEQFTELTTFLKTLSKTDRHHEQDWRVRIDRADLAMVQWVNRVEERSNWGEMGVILVLGAGSIISLVVQLGYSIQSMLLSLLFSFCIAYIIAEIRMYEHMSARVCFVALANGSLRDLFKEQKLYLPEEWLLSALCRRQAKIGTVRVRTDSGSISELEPAHVAIVATRTRVADRIIGALALLFTAGMIAGLVMSEPATQAMLTAKRIDNE